jgi:beta-xylosidase
MNIHEKTAQMYAVWLIIDDRGKVALKQSKGSRAGDSKADPRQIMKHGIGQITRPLGTHPVEAAACVRGLNEIQRFLVENTRLGIPALPHEECVAGLMAQGATIFPSGIGCGSLWDEALVEKISRAIGEELHSVGSRQGLAPVLDVSRDVRWGRTEETTGEDPYLVGCLGIAYTRGLQGDGRRVLATLKHFAGHSFGEGGRNHAPVRIGERELFDTLILPFEMVLKLTEAGSVMPAYHDLDGTPLHSSRRLLTELLRERWGFDGLIVSDYEGIALLYQDHRVAEDAAAAAALAVKAGVDVELPGYSCFKEGLEQALDRGLLDIAEIDQAVTRILVEKSRLGLFEHPYTDEKAIQLNTKHSRELAAEAAAKSMVLLKNDGILPLTKRGTTALVGPLADDGLCMCGAYSFPLHILSSGLSQDKAGSGMKTLRQCLGRRLGAGLLYARGCDILEERPEEAPVFPGEVGPEASSGRPRLSDDESGISGAAETAAKADRVILAVGDQAGMFRTGTVGEGSDVSSLHLPGVQQKLLDALLGTGKPVVVVLISGRPYHLGEAFGKASAVLEAWLPGQEGAEAIAGVLLGETNPGGKLPVSIPKTAGALPYFYNHKPKSGGMPLQPEFGAEYPFGFGLSYTSFSFDQFAVAEPFAPMDGQFELSFRLTNTGDREGEEVAQLYVRDLYASQVRPVMELKGFRRIALPPKGSARVSFTVPVDMLGFTGPDNRRILEPGQFELMIGSSSRDIHFRKVVALQGETRTLPENWRMRSSVSVRMI